MLRRVLDGTLYDALPYQFHEERSAGGEYIPLRSRRPSVRYALCRIVVEDSVALLFSEGHFPTIDCADRSTRATLADIVKETRLNQVMTEAAMRGAIGSVAILMRVLRGRVFFSVLDTTYLTPVWDAEAPDTLVSVTEKYKVAGGAARRQRLRARRSPGNTGSCAAGIRRTRPGSCPGRRLPTMLPEIDEARTVHHGLGFVPLVWVRNLPGLSATGDAE